jgi:hypothetical protein
MPIDVVSSAVIHRPREVVAAFAGNPDNAPVWYVNIKRVEWKTPRPARGGTRVRLVVRFLGRPLAYTYEVVDLVPGARLVMRTVDGPFPMETTYEWEDAGPASTRMTLRNRGAPRGFSAWITPVIGMAVRRATRKHLARLKAFLEGTLSPADMDGEPAA